MPSVPSTRREQKRLDRGCRTGYGKRSSKGDDHVFLLEIPCLTHDGPTTHWRFMKSLRYQIVAVALATGAFVHGQNAPSEKLSEVSPEFRRLYDFPLRNAEASGVAAGLPCDSIEMEFICVGGCAYDSGYKLVLNRSLEATLHRNSANRSRFGETGTSLDYSGGLNVADFGKLCQMAMQPAFAAIQSNYVGNGGADGIQTTVTIKSRSSAAKVIVERNTVGPIELWSFQRSLEAVAARIRWAAK